MATRKNPETASRFKRVRSVTLPAFKIEKGTVRYFAFLSPMFLGDKIDAQKNAAVLAHALDMETGEEGQLIVPAVMMLELERSYPKSAYVRKGFSLVMTRVPEKRYNLCEVAEVAIPDDLTLPAAGGGPATPERIKAYQDYLSAVVAKRGADK